jgi:hypothetical protein
LHKARAVACLIKTTDMDLENLSAAFAKIKGRLLLPEYLQKICLNIAAKGLSRNDIDKELTAVGINHSIAKVDFLHLIIAYIKIVLEDDILTTTEKGNIKFLKLLFRIHPGDFLFHDKGNIEKIIAYQLYQIYKDNSIADEEALLKVDLQEVFDLSFDQMNDYSKKEIEMSIPKGTDPIGLDIFLSQKEYFKLKT